MMHNGANVPMGRTLSRRNCAPLFAVPLCACFVSIPDVRTNGSTIPSGSCRLKAPVFCETFGTPSPGGRGGDLDETRWNVARIGESNASQQRVNWWPAVTTEACGQTTTVMADQDLEVCGGQLSERSVG